MDVGGIMEGIERIERIPLWWGELSAYL